MAPIQEIQYWLTKKTPYSYGVQLLATITPNQRLIFNLQRSETAKNLEKVVYELEKYVRDNHNLLSHDENKQEIHPTESEGNVISSKPPIRTKQSAIRTQNELPTITPSNRNSSLASDSTDLVERVKEKRVLLYRKRGHLHGRLHEVLGDKQRLSLAKEIVRIQKDIEKVYTDLELIEKGKTPRSIMLEMMSGKDMKQYRNAQNYVVRYKNYLKKDGLSEEKRERYQEKLDQYQKVVDSFF